jgi:hypothetical protein
MRSSRRAVAAFLLLCVAAAGVIVAVVHDARTPGQAPIASTATPGTSAPLAVTEPRARLYFRSAAAESFGKLAYVELGTGERNISVVDLACEAVHASGGRGICLSVDRSLMTPFVTKIFDVADHSVRATLPLAGLPSRTRVARNGRLGATTVFVTGHGYDSVEFSTQTLLLDLDTGTALADVEQFEFLADGKPIRESDFNVWGVTFLEDGNTFYATLSTQMRHLLVRGDARARQAHVVHENVECPSVSPDGTRVAYKRRYLDGNFVRWQLYVLDLRTNEEIPLGENRSVDDQLEWLDDERVLYTLIDTSGIVGNSVWTIAADGTGKAERFLAAASSPALVR